MCNVFSGHIIAEKGKDWGKVVFDSGVHHEKDREKPCLKDKRMLAWQSKVPYSLTEFEFTHDCGQGIEEKEKAELMKLLEKWAKKQDKEKLLRSMITVTKDNKPTEDYLIQENMIKIGDKMSLVCDFSVNVTAEYKSTQTAGYGSTQKAGEESTQKAGNWSTQKAGNWSTQTTGYGSTQKAGNWSTQTAEYKSTQKAGDGSTCIIYGDTSYIVLDGENVLLTQIWYENGKYQRAVLKVDKLFKKYKKDDKVKIVKGKDMGKVK